MDGSETVIAAAKRECLEEVGVDIDVERAKIVHAMHRFSDDERISYFVFAGGWRGEPHVCEPDKADLVQWASLDALPGNTIPYIVAALNHWQAGESFSTFGYEDYSMK